MMELPVHSLSEPLLRAVAETGRLLLRAPTGSGKSTCVPPMLLDGGVERLIVVVQPRRIAARMLARRVAEVRSTRVGEEIGYVVRFENNMGDRTRIVYLTDGVLQRWLHENPNLDGVGAVVFDEFHERLVASDVALARCLDLRDGERSDLKLVVMSATLEVQGLQNYLEPCATLEAGGRMFPVEISYRGAGAPPVGGRHAPAIWDRVTEAVRDAISNTDCGHVLVFLPGVHEIRRAIEQSHHGFNNETADLLLFCSKVFDQFGAHRPGIEIGAGVRRVSRAFDQRAARKMTSGYKSRSGRGPTFSDAMARSAGASYRSRSKRRRLSSFRSRTFRTPQLDTQKNQVSTTRHF